MLLLRDIISRDKRKCGDAVMDRSYFLNIYNAKKNMHVYVPDADLLQIKPDIKVCCFSVSAILC
jgi:hypothetical protein